MRNPFDPTVLLARYLHPRVCDLEHDFDEGACLTAGQAVDELRRELLAAGLAAVPAATLGYLERAFGEMVTGETEPESIQLSPGGPAAELYHSQVRIRKQLRDGRVEYTEPTARWRAEIMLGLLNAEHGPEVASARIEPEPAWIAQVMEGLPEF